MNGARRNAQVDALVERELMRWRANEKLRREQPRQQTTRRDAIGPYVSIARETGAYGDELGYRVGEKLGWQVFGSEIVDYIANEAHVRKQVVASFDEKIQDSVETWIETLLTRAMLDNDHYLKHLTQVVWMLAGPGKAVFIGRGASFILPAERGLQVRVVGSQEWRLKNLIDQENLTEAEARRTLSRRDQEGAFFIRRHFHKQAENATNYHMVLNIEQLGIECCADLIIAAVNAQVG